ncbi:MAG: InlB B-repeat-containing protein [Clostridiales bacterium]|nr:InlB B-repeat-containing protein [Clostridiales bacterium]
MKKFRRVLLLTLFAVILALGAVCFTACGDKSDGKKSKSQYTLTFMNGTVLYDTVTALEGSEYKDKMKSDPFRINNVFNGWSRTPNGAVEALPDKMPSENRTYYAIFSARYNLNLNVGIGALPAGVERTISVKDGDDLYAILSEIVPTLSGGDAVFDAWYLRGTDKITASSGHKMPKSNVEVVAKYAVGYTVKIYKEIKYDSGNYPTAPNETITQTAHVGNKVTGLPMYNGFYYDDEKENEVLYTNLNKDSTQNTFSLYYKVLGYETIFNANLPEDVEFTGKTDTMTCGHGESQEAPECGFTADGYRFDGWATDPDGDVQYRAGETFTVERATTLYAKWVKGLTEISGVSSDRVYIMKKPDQPTLVVAYLERTGLDDILGEYNALIRMFTFKNAHSDSDTVMLRGIADTSRGIFVYLNTQNTTEYTLQNLDRTVNDNVKLKLSDDGKAVYNDGTDTKNGSYATGEDGSLLFTVDGKTEFAFRIVQSDDGLTRFMIRGNEFGKWNNITQASVVNRVYTLELDGYGYATMYVYGIDSSLTGNVTNTFRGLYVYTTGEGAYTGDKGTEVAVMLYNNSLYVRQFACLLITGEYYSNSSTDTDVYTHVYLERFETTLYAAPEGDEKVDKETADKIVLAGYSVLDNSATYISGDTEIKGKYEYDRTAGTLRITPSDGRELLFEITVITGENEESIPVFEPVNELFGQYFVNRLDKVFGPSGLYMLHIYNNNIAAFAFRVPVSDSFYGNILYEYTRMIFGEYKVAIEGKDDNGQPDPRANVYEFSAEVSPSVFYYIYNLYGSLYGSIVGTSLDVRRFGSFRFQFVYSASTGRISYVNATVAGDFQEGQKVTYNDVEYTLDGFGTANAQDGSSIKYSYDTNIGIKRLFLFPDASKPDDSVLFIDAKNDGVFVEYKFDYVTANSGTQLNMIFFEDDTAILAVKGSSGFNEFSYGNVVWGEEKSRVVDDKDKKIHYEYTYQYGTYTRDTEVQFSDVFATVNKTYPYFDFAIVTTVATDEKDKTTKTIRIYLYDIGANTPNKDGKVVIVKSNGDELTINPADLTATYIRKGVDGGKDTEYTGSFNYYDGTLQILYAIKGSTTPGRITLKLEYNAEGVITSFSEVSSLAGYYLSADDTRSYLYITGEELVKDSGEYTAVYYQYNPDSEGDEDKYTAYNGTFKTTSKENTIGYDFTYATGEKGEDDKDITETFTFAFAVDATGIQLFVKYKILLSTYVLGMTATEGIGRVGALQGGGYDPQYFTLFNSRYEGVMEWNDEWAVWVFTTTGGSMFFFRFTTNGIFLLDNTYAAETKGMYELSETVYVDVPATEGKPETEDTPEVPAVEAHRAEINKIEMTGMAFAYLHYTYKDQEMMISGLYVRYASNGFAFLKMDDEEITVLFRFRLMRYEEGEEEEKTVRFVAELADLTFFGTYEGDDLTAINLNGFNSAYYVDSFGTVYSGAFETKEINGVTYIKVTYLDTRNYTIKYAYAKLDLENRTFVEVDASEYGDDEAQGGDDGDDAAQISLKYDQSYAYNKSNAAVYA